MGGRVSVGNLLFFSGLVGVGGGVGGYVEPPRFFGVKWGVKRWGLFFNE